MSISQTFRVAKLFEKMHGTYTAAHYLRQRGWPLHLTMILLCKKGCKNARKP